MPTKPALPIVRGKGRCSQVVRIMRLWRILSEHMTCGMTIEDMRAELDCREVSKRAVYRDLDALRDAGVRIDTARDPDDNHVRYYLIGPIVINPK